MTSFLVVPETMMRDATSSSHVTSDHLASFLDGRLTGIERERAVSHFAECADCRSELAELRGLLETSRPARNRAWIGAAAALAAALAFAVVPRIDGDTRQDDAFSTGPTGVRASGGEARIAVHRPADGTSLSPSERQLIWQATGTGVEYSVRVQDAAGTSLWSARLADTAAVVPDTVRLMSGQRYYWSVQARLADGGSAKTGPIRFTIR